jgi:biopolymer transport protein ExbB/TolQ
MFFRLDHALYLVSTSLLVPVLVALSLLLLWTMLLLGGFVREWMDRRSYRRQTKPLIAGLLREDLVARESLRQQSGVLLAGGFLPHYLRSCWSISVTDIVADKRIDDIEIEMGRRLGTLGAIGRLGPMLGLAGTLIPLGPALVELARGNVAALAGQLVVAFSATIVGLLVGMGAVAAGQIRRGWYARDLSDILFLEELRTQNNGAVL